MSHGFIPLVKDPENYPEHEVSLIVDLMMHTHACVFRLLSLVAERMQITIVVPVLTRISVYGVCANIVGCSRMLWKQCGLHRRVLGVVENTFMALHNTVFACTLSSNFPLPTLR